MSASKPALAFAVALVVAASATAQEPHAGNDVYRKVAPSTVAFVNKSGAPNGTGVLIDAKEKLVLTAYHVVNGLGDERFNVRVFFPRFEEKRILTDAYEYARLYRKDAKSLVVQGRVIAFDPIKDLALVKLDDAPADRPGIGLAKDEPEPGEAIHVIGNSTGGRGGVFGYNKGYVRNSFLHGKNTFCFFALCHQSPTNRGDSGGPVLNDRGEIVAIISHGTTGEGDVEQVVDYSVHAREIHAFLAGKATYKEPCALPSRSFFSLKAKARVEGLNDMVFFPIRSGDKLSLEMKGNAGTDLDLFLDPAMDLPALIKVKRIGDADQEKVDFEADWTGPCRVKIANWHAVAIRKDFAAKKLTPPALTRDNDYVLDIRSELAGPGPVVVLRRIGPSSSDDIRLHYEAGKNAARITLVGQGYEDLDIAVFDPLNKKVAAADTFASRETVSFVPAIAGVYTIRVVNLDGKRFCRYHLITD